VTEIELDKLLYGDSPLGRSSTPKSLASITLEDVKAFYAKIYRPADAIFVVAGNVSEEKGKELASTLVGGWGEAKVELAPAPKLDLPKEPTKRTIILVDNPDARQAAIKMGIPAYTIASDEKYAGSLANQILSGGIESRVMKYVRAEKGLAYHAHGVFQPARHAGAFIGATDTAIENSTDAIEAMFKVFNDVRNDGVTDAEVKDAQLRVAGSLVMGMQTIEQQAQRRLEGILNGYPADYYDNYAKKVAEVSAGQIQEIMNKYVKPDAMQIVVVAPAAASKEKLSKLGEVKVEAMPGKGEEMLK
jgi:zinc protease